MVFVGRNHPIYTEADKKTPKRVGNLIKSSSASLHGMLMAHKEDVQNFIKGLVKSSGPESPMDEDLAPTLNPALNEVDMIIQPVDHIGRAKQQQMEGRARQQQIEGERERNETRRLLNAMGSARF